ncbi:MAG: hypothetical protein V2I97_11185 [Desulfococcaceae bacterium]|jgi:hypothetical protein|nr:hypothetical protein [Desulfococcaceae bacterium]
MNRANKKGRIGSQRLLQITVAEYPELLRKALQKAGAVGESEKISWTSPLEREQFKEYRDNAFLKKIGVENSVTYPLDKFWPGKGPVWDATGITDKGRPVLLEAKAHIPEIVSPPSGASPGSLKLIEESLQAAKRHYAPRSRSAWPGTFYQYANRLAHQYFLQKCNNTDSILIFLYFINAAEMKGPTSASEWKGAVKLIHAVLGLPENLEHHGIYHAFIDANFLKVEA